jgi:ribose-phosphate pyrophosphokinase
MLVLGFSEYEEAGQRLAKELGCPYREVDVHVFPDGEHKLTLPLPLPEHLVVCRSLFDPNAKLVDLLLLAGTARENGVKELTLVAPYLCYMRQDIAFHPGEAVSQRLIGQLLAELFDTVITVDPHLHRTPDFADAVPARRAVRLTATGPMADFLSDPGYRETVLLGPDGESRQWVSAIAKKTGQAFGVARKQRSGDRDIRIELPEIDVQGRRVVIVDDVISTGRTVAVAASLLREAGAAGIECLVTHVLPGTEMQATLKRVGVTALVSCDSIPHPSNRIELAGILAAAIRDEPAR